MTPAGMTDKQYTCGLCWSTYDPKRQGHCQCGRHPHLGDDCDHDCDSCASVLFPPRDGHHDLFHPDGSRWVRVPRDTQSRR